MISKFYSEDHIPRGFLDPHEAVNVVCVVGEMVHVFLIHAYGGCDVLKHAEAWLRIPQLISVYWHMKLNLFWATQSTQ